MGFKIGHIAYGGAIKGRLKGQIPWNAGISVWVEYKCLECGKDFKIRECHTGRNRGKYCSKKCFAKGQKGRIPYNKGIIETKKCLQCSKSFNIRPCERYRKFCSRKCAKRPLKPHWGKYKGINMRSGYEIGYAKYLDKNNTKWEYEPKTFDLGYTTYTPDFYLPEKQVYVEIKGWMRLSAFKKIKKFVSQNPDIKFLLLMEKDLKQINAIECVK